MITFRSPLLKALPGAVIPNRFRRFLKRILWISPFFAAIVFYWRQVANPDPAAEGWRYWIHWIHDHVQLVFMGRAYHLFYPDSLKWWLFFGTVFTVCAVSFLLVVSSNRRAHIPVSRAAVRNARLHTILVFLIRKFRKIKFPLRLLEEVMIHERSIALHLVAAAPFAGERVKRHRSLASVTRLYLLSFPGPGSSHGACFISAFCWRETLAWIRLGDVLAEGSDPLDALGRELSPLVFDILKPVVTRWAPSEFWKTTPGPNGFDEASAAVDLFHLACYHRPDLAGKTGEWELAKQSPDAIRPLIAQRLFESTSARRAAMEEMLYHLPPPGQESPHSPRRKRTLEELPSLPVETALLPPLGALGLGIALDLAIMADEPEIALGYMDAIESMAFALETASPGTTGLPRAYLGKMSALIKGLPGPLDHGMGAILAERKHERRKRMWERSPFHESGPILEKDFELDRFRIASLRRAAGPGLDSRQGVPKK